MHRVKRLHDAEHIVTSSLLFTNAHVGVTNGERALPSPPFQVLCVREVYSQGP